MFTFISTLCVPVKMQILVRSCFLRLSNQLSGAYRCTFSYHFFGDRTAFQRYREVMFTYTSDFTAFSCLRLRFCGLLPNNCARFHLSWPRILSNKYAMENEMINFALLSWKCWRHTSHSHSAHTKTS